jgi:beta-1,4-mannosyltransferase
MNPSMNDLLFRGYMYPYTARDNAIKNPYITNFMDALAGRIEFVNRNSTSAFGLFAILKHIHKIDILFLNWPEDILEKKGGLLQSFFFYFLIQYLKFKNVKVFLVFHNKESHFKNKIRLKIFIRNFTIRKSDYIITHAREGVSIVERLSKPGNSNIMFFHHPVLPAVNLIIPNSKKYDILIWGMVTPYKGIDHFLEFIRDEKQDHLKIMIAGKIPDATYRSKILAYSSRQVEIMDKFIAVQQLEELIAQSRAVLFTYLENSILSSGALMDTLRYAPLIIGPNCGAFKDLYGEGLIRVYDDYAHLKTCLKNLDEKPDTTKIHRFIEDHSWAGFGAAVYNFIKLNQ